MIMIATTMNNHKHVVRITVTLSFCMHFPKMHNQINFTLIQLYMYICMHNIHIIIYQA